MHRENDEPLVEVTRKISVWQLGTVIFLLLANGFATFYAIKNLAEKQTEQTITFKELNTKLDRIDGNWNERRVEDAKRDFTIADHERRLQGLEAKGKQ